MQRLLERVITDDPWPVLVIGRDLRSILPPLEKALGSGDAIETLEIDDGDERITLAADDDSIHTIVLHRPLGLLGDGALMRLLHECRRVLCDGGRIAIADYLVPVDRVLSGGKRGLLRKFGVRYTSTEVYALMESAGFWQCIVMRRGTLDRAVVVKGEKVLQRAELERHPTLNTNPTFRLIK